MPVIPINIDRRNAVPRMADMPVLVRALDALPKKRPVIVMLHGYKFSPSSHAHSPHTHILSVSPSRGRGNLSWPRHLGFGKGQADEGLCIALGWEARGTIWHAYQSATASGVALATLVGELASYTGRPVDFFAHSLGAHLALNAISDLPARSVGRVILLSGAAFCDDARRALESEAGQGADFINVTSRENDLFDLLFERLLQMPWRSMRALGRRLEAAPDNWLNLPIDTPQARAVLATAGFAIPPPRRRICHWSGYRRAGLFAVYNALLRERLDLAALRGGPNINSRDVQT